MKSKTNILCGALSTVVLATSATLLLSLPAAAEVFTEGKQVPASSETQSKPGFKVFGPGEVAPR